MKKAAFAFALILICCVVCSPVAASANSAQRYFEGVTASGALINETDCPIEVAAERLTFNITDSPQVDEDSPNYTSNVVAEYDFYNPKDYDVNMQLVFPFGRIPYWIRDDYVDTHKYGAFVNDIKVDSSIRAIYADYGVDFDLSRDLKKISDERKRFDYDIPDDTPVYKYKAKSSFIHNYERAESPYAEYAAQGHMIVFADSVRYSGFTRGSTAEVYGDDWIELYSVGSELDENFFSPTYHITLLRKESAKAGDVWYRGDTVQIDGNTEYLYLEQITFEDLVLVHYDEQSGISRNDWYNAAVDCSHGEFAAHGFTDTRALNMTNRLLLWYQYDVSVPAKSTVTNKVVAPLYPAIDVAYTPTKYSYEYLLSPASSWAKFSNLDITVNTDKYVLAAYTNGSGETPVDFTKTANGYAAHFDTLPKGELYFELCASQNPDYDNGGGWLLVLLLALAAPFLFVFAVIIVIIIVVAVRKRKARKAQQTVGSSQTISDEQRDAAMEYFFDDAKKDEFDKK